MTSSTDRIAQFENMAKEDPSNDMAHFSLGNAYLQAGRPQDAAISLHACIEINPEMSKAYQLAGQALIETDEKEEAAKVLKRGYEMAASRGDVMPRDAIAQLLEGIGQDLPEVAVVETAPPVDDGPRLLKQFGLRDRLYDLDRGSRGRDHRYLRRGPGDDDRRGDRGRRAPQRSSASRPRLPPARP